MRILFSVPCCKLLHSGRQQSNLQILNHVNVILAFFPSVLNNSSILFIIVKFYEMGPWIEFQDNVDVDLK
jgi:hypothetical protein